MPRSEKKYALVSCFDKSGLDQLATALKARGYSFLASGGSAKFLRDLGFEVLAVEDLTGFPHILDGRVKTLHPLVFGGILAKRSSASHLDQLKELDAPQIDVVVVNLYPFADADDADKIEMIDIGGVALLRAAAKNHKFVTTLSDPQDYPRLITALESDAGLDDALRLDLAIRAFGLCSKLDGMISDWLAESKDKQAANKSANKADSKSDASILPASYSGLPLKRVLRYGENPHQAAGYYSDAAEVQALQGKPLSYNNLRDAEAAYRLVQEWHSSTKTACVIIKHCNPCGAAIADNAQEAWARALSTDSQAAFGGVVAFNRKVDEAAALAMREVFLEVVIAPEFSAKAIDILSSRKNLRLLSFGEAKLTAGLEAITAAGGLLLQQTDSLATAAATSATGAADATDAGNKWQAAGRQASKAELEALDLAWKVAAHARSNAIVLGSENLVTGIGCGVTSRVRAASHAVQNMAQFGHKTDLLVAASDGFFPFPDGLEILIEAGISAVVQPGGSMRDKQVIAVAEKHDVAMYIAGDRHFRH